jgi:hypothetical protein
MTSDEIQSRQNEENLLKIQYAARKYYNTAEKLNNYVWLLCLMSALSLFLPVAWPTLLTHGIPFCADLVAAGLMLLVNHKVTTAAKLRRYFDAYVLNICLDDFSVTEIRKIKEISDRTYSKKTEKSKIQMTNIGYDSPPGVLEWYVFQKPYFGFSAQLECQRQNAWWNSKMLRTRLMVTLCAAILVSIGFVLFMVKGEILISILGLAGLLIKIVERIIENGKYIMISIQIDGALKAIEPCPTKESVEKLQNFIDKRREVNVLEFNWFHERFANMLSKSYDNSTP